MSSTVASAQPGQSSDPRSSAVVQHAERSSNQQRPGPPPWATHRASGFAAGAVAEPGAASCGWARCSSRSSRAAYSAWPGEKATARRNARTAPGSSPTLSSACPSLGRGGARGCEAAGWRRRRSSRAFAPQARRASARCARLKCVIPHSTNAIMAPSASATARHESPECRWHTDRLHSSVAVMCLWISTVGESWSAGAARHTRRSRGSRGWARPRAGAPRPAGCPDGSCRCRGWCGSPP